MADFDLLWVTIESNYCYFDRKHVDWQKVYKVYRPQAEAARSREEFITVLERTLDELYDPHTTLRVNNPNSTRLIPTGLDLWAEWKDGKAIVTQVRPGFGAGPFGQPFHGSSQRWGLQRPGEVGDLGGHVPARCRSTCPRSHHAAP